MSDTIEREAMRRVTFRLLPILFLTYVSAYLDRSNIGVAALQMNGDLGFGPAVFGFGAGVFYLGYAALEIPSNLILARVGNDGHISTRRTNVSNRGEGIRPLR